MGSKDKRFPKKLRYALVYNKILQNSTKFNVCLMVLALASIQIVFKFLIHDLETNAHLPSADFELIPLDLTMGYTPKEAYEQIAAYGADGRFWYGIVALSLDILHLVIYNLVFAMFLVLFLQYGAPSLLGALYKYTLVPFLIALVDFAENICVALLLFLYPAELNILVYTASTLTIVKWILILIVLTALIVGVIVYFLQQRRFLD